MALMLTYAGCQASWRARNMMVMVDRRGWKLEGMLWVPFDGEEEEEGEEEKKEPEPEVPEGFNRMREGASVVERGEDGRGGGWWGREWIRFGSLVGLGGSGRGSICLRRRCWRCEGVFSRWGSGL